MANNNTVPSPLPYNFGKLLFHWNSWEPEILAKLRCFPSKTAHCRRTRDNLFRGPCSSVCKVTKCGGVLQCHFLWWVRLEAVKSTMVVLTYLLNTLQELSLLRGKGETSASKVLTMWKSAILCTDVKCACGGTRILSTGNAEKGLSRLSGHHSRPIGQLQVSWEKLSQRVMWSVIKEDSTRERESRTSPPESVWDGS